MPQFSSVAQSCPTLWDSMDSSTPGLPVHHPLPEFTQTHVHWVSDVLPSSHPLSCPSPPALSHLILCCPLLLLPSIFPSIRVFSNESLLHIRWPKYWSFSFSISPSNEYLGLISFRIDYLISLLSKELSSVFSSTTIQSISYSALSLWPKSCIWRWLLKNHSLDYRDFVSKLTSLLLNTLSRFVITFIPRSKHLLISWLQSPSAVILESKKIKSDPVSTVSPSISHTGS